MTSRVLLTMSLVALSLLNISAGGPPPPIVGDALYAPQSVIPGTSEYMIGRVAVSIILLESDGGVDPSTEDWTDTEVALVLREIEDAFAWWEAREPKAHLNFVYEWEMIPTSYEPITRPQQEQNLWIREVMLQKGMTTVLPYFDQVRRYNHDLLDAHDADHAFTIFVVDSSEDRDGRFACGCYFAYAYIGGPFMVMTYDNGGYGSHNTDAVAAHEIGHVFWAIDQYYAARQVCTRRSGYLDVENQNSQFGDCAIDEPSLMRGQVWPFQMGDLDYYARGQVGWRDSDCDGILDPVDSVASECYRVYLPTVGRKGGIR